jgi:LysR family transcriptional regulator, glycine cleavage system transcriptional activator
MHQPIPPLNALRAFEAAARHLSVSKAAQELRVTASALSHQICGLEELLGLKLFQRRARSIALTSAGHLLYPGLQTGFMHIHDALTRLRNANQERVLVISTSPGFTSKWLAPRLYRFATTYPEIDVRVSSSVGNANFTTDGVDVAVRNLPINDQPDSMLAIEKLTNISFVPVCSPKLMRLHGRPTRPQALARMPLIHDDTLLDRPHVPTWADWFKAANVNDAEVSRGMRFNSPDHALQAAGEGAGVLLSQYVLAYDDLRSGRLVIPVKFMLSTGRAYHFVCPKSRSEYPHVQAFRTWIKQEVTAIDWTLCGQGDKVGRTGGGVKGRFR